MEHLHGRRRGAIVGAPDGRELFYWSHEEMVVVDIATDRCSPMERRMWGSRISTSCAFHSSWSLCPGHHDYPVQRSWSERIDARDVSLV